MDSRCCIYWDGCSITTHRHYSAVGENEGYQWKDHRKLHFLGFLHAHRTAFGSASILLRLASKIRLC